jgi:hypothetical protein
MPLVSNNDLIFDRLSNQNKKFTRNALAQAFAANALLSRQRMHVITHGSHRPPCQIASMSPISSVRMWRPRTFCLNIGSAELIRALQAVDRSAGSTQSVVIDARLDGGQSPIGSSRAWAAWLYENFIHPFKAGAGFQALQANGLEFCI